MNGAAVATLTLLLGLGMVVTMVASHDVLILDDRSSGDLASSHGAVWRLVTDGVMGGVSRGRLRVDRVAGRDCLRLSGEVRLENNGGFIQAALDLGSPAALDASAYRGILLEVYGNGEPYNLHLRTAELRLPWQAYRASFTAPARWQQVRIPFEAFEAYRVGRALDTRAIARIGLVAIGRAFTADVCLAQLGLYREAPGGS